MNWGTNEKGTNEMGDQWVGGTNEMGDQWDGGPMRWGTNEMGDQWDGGPMMCTRDNTMGDNPIWRIRKDVTHAEIFSAIEIESMPGSVQIKRTPI